MISLLNCDCCKFGIVKHRAVCKFCEKTHNICEECYQHGIKHGNLIEKHYTKPEIDEGFKKRLA